MGETVAGERHYRGVPQRKKQDPQHKRQGCPQAQPVTVAGGRQSRQGQVQAACSVWGWKDEVMLS